MRGLLIACLLAATPLHAWAAMTTAECENTWDAFTRFALINQQDRATAKNFTVAETDDGWCNVDPSGLVLSDVSFSSAAFRVDGWGSGGTGETTLDVSINDLGVVGGVFEVSLVARQDQQTGELLLTQLSARGADGSGVRASGMFSMAPFDSVAAAQTSIAGIKISALNAQIFATPAFIKGLSVDFTGVTRVAMNNALRDVVSAQVSGASRQEFLRFAGATPQSRGTLEINLTAPSELAIMQIAAPLMGLPRSPTDPNIARAIGIALSGLTLDLAWKPGRI